MPKTKRSKAARRASALKGWKTRRRKARKKPRYHGVEIRAGYQGRDNSFTLAVILNTHKPISRYSPDQLADLVEKLAQKGHFDDSTNNPTADLSWVFFNRWEVVRDDVKIGRGKARLIGFTRRAPGSV